MFFKVKKFIYEENLINENETVILGLSGGADSATLFDIFKKLSAEINFKIIAVHINHNLRDAESLRDENFVRQLCERSNITLEVFSVDLKKYASKNKMSTEEAGRFYRYECFKKIFDLHNGDKIATAHNKNDQAETLLMRIFRGTGAKGLGGINPQTGNIIRPLLYCERTEILNYCTENNLEYVEDSTNSESVYTRNKIRLELLPHIEENFNQNIIENLSNLADLLREEDNYFENKMHKLFQEIVVIKNKMMYIDIVMLENLDIVLMKRLLRFAIHKFSGSIKDISHRNIADILNLIKNRTGKTLNLPSKLTAQIEYGNLIFYFEHDLQDSEFSYLLEMDKVQYIKELNQYISIGFKKLDFDSNKCLNLCTKIYSYDTIKSGVHLRTRKPRDIIKLKTGTKKIKDVFIDDKIPKNQRNNIPLLADGDNIIWIMHGKHRESALYKDIKGKEIYVQIWEDFKSERDC